MFIFSTVLVSWPLCKLTITKEREGYTGTHQCNQYTHFWPLSLVFSYLLNLSGGVLASFRVYNPWDGLPKLINQICVVLPVPPALLPHLIIYSQAFGWQPLYSSNFNPLWFLRNVYYPFQWFFPPRFQGFEGFDSIARLLQGFWGLRDTSRKGNWSF